MSVVISGAICSKAVGPSAAHVELNDGHAIWVTERYLLGGSEIPAELVATFSTAKVLFVEAEFFGGSGAQAAVGYEAGRVSIGPLQTQDVGGGLEGFRELGESDHGWAINDGLAWLGVQAGPEADEFETVGLGDFRWLTVDDVQRKTEQA